MQVLIIEDEAPASRRLIKLINECDPAIKVAGVIQSVKDGIEWFGKNSAPDLILSDIQLADDLSFTIFKELQTITPIIFITAFDEYAINAFKFYSIDYLLKPVRVEDLKAGFDKFRNITIRNSVNNNFDDLIARITQKSYRERFLVYSADNLRPVMVNEIAYFQSDGGSTVLVTSGGRKFSINESLENLECELDPKKFFRVNRQYLVSLNGIDKISNYGLQKLCISVKVESNEKIIISKLKVSQFKNWLDGRY